MHHVVYYDAMLAATGKYWHIWGSMSSHVD